MKPNPRVIVPALLVVIAIVATVVVVRRARDRDLAAAGTVEATEAVLGFPTAGRIEAVRVREGDSVKRGDVLAALDTIEASARLQQAAAQVDAARFDPGVGARVQSAAARHPPPRPEPTKPRMRVALVHPSPAKVVS